MDQNQTTPGDPPDNPNRGDDIAEQGRAGDRDVPSDPVESSTGGAENNGQGDQPA